MAAADGDSSVHITALRERRRLLGARGLERIAQEWADLLPALQEERAKGTHPSNPQVQQLLARYQSLLAEFTGGDALVADVLRQKYESVGPHIERQFRWDRTSDDALQSDEGLQRAAGRMEDVFAALGGRDEFMDLLSYIRDALAFHGLSRPVANP